MVILVFSWAVRAAASDGAVWLAPHPARPACIHDGELRVRVESLLGRSVFVDASEAADLHAQIEFAPEDGGWTASITLRSRGGEPVGARTVHTPEPACRALDDAFSLVLALALDIRTGEARVSLPPEVDVPDPRLEADSDSERPLEEADLEAPPLTEAPPSRSVRVEASIGARVAVGRLLDPLFDLSAGLALEIAPWLEVAWVGAFSPPSREAVGSDLVERWVTGGELWARFPVRLDDLFALRPRVGLGLARFEARALEVTSPRTGEGFLAELLVGVDLVVPAVGGVTGVLRLELGVPLVANRLRVLTGGTERTVFSPPPVFFRASFAISLGVAQ